jgi:outer membrane receptor protein involved in Fe transport
MTAYQPHVYTRQPGNDTVDNGGVGWGPDGTAAGPSTSVTALARYQVTDAFTIDVMQRWRDKLKISGVPSDLFAPGEGAVDSWTTTNLNLTYEKKGAAGSPAVFLNIQNLFDKHPPIGAYTANGTRAGARDGFAVGDNPMGRYYTLGVRLNY